MAEKLDSLQDLFIHSLNDLQNAEEQLIKAMPKMADAATSSKVKSAFEKHLKQTQTQKDTLDQVFQMIGTSPSGEECVGMKGLIEEGQKIIQMGGKSEVIDAALIASAQKVEHYEISGYGTLRALAKQLGHDEAGMLIQKILDQEGQTDHELTMIAEETINPKAAQV